MLSYKCKVIDIFGRGHSIYHRSPSVKDLIDYLKANKFTIISIKKREDISLSNLRGKRIRSKDLAVFSKQVYTMLKAGLTIVNILNILRDQTENKKLRAYISLIHEDLQKGNTFSQSLDKVKGAFPQIFISMVQAGELSGNLDEIMDRLSKHYEKEYKIENKIKSAMAYPLILSIVSIGVVIFLLRSIMPTFVEMYINSGVSLPTLTLTIINISNLLKEFFLLILLGLGVFIFIISSAMKIPKVKMKKDYFKLKIPLVKNLITKLAAARFARTLSTLLANGVDLLQALESLAGVTGNLYISRKILDLRDHVRKGMPLSLIMEKQGIFPPMLYYMIKIGEDSGSLEEILDKTGDFYDEEIESVIQSLTTLLEPIMIVLMAIIIGFIVIAMVLPMFAMVQSVR